MGDKENSNASGKWNNRILVVIAVMLLALVLEHALVPVSIQLDSEHALVPVGNAPPYFKRMRLLNNTEEPEPVKVESVEVRRMVFDEGSEMWRNQWEDVTTSLVPNPHDETTVIGPGQAYAPEGNMDVDFINGVRVRIRFGDANPLTAEVKLDGSSQSVEIFCLVEPVQVGELKVPHLRMWLVHGTSTGIGEHKFDDSSN